ncbi:SDR family oxidoreductase [Pseudomarimonas arenosa]|uniref:SDR family oxidoreductase n=1 Tax=Pseudomarimonas arenosa TaxID=2774145 RepID=A0AAW3ZPN2_9GAMM|nr:SDR family oxidoreductase [Pseudomarimonas arenosa]MBD8526604.1 SDR family oxidoreductase [Pseudomarimonas arenosa]
MRIQASCDVLITGASGGIGSALALACAARGAHVLACGRNRDRLDAIVARARSMPGRLQTLRADIGSSEGRSSLVDATTRFNGSSMVLLHAAARNQLALFADQTERDVQEIMQINAIAPLALTRALLPMLLRRESAAVVAIGSTFGSIGYPGFASYSASKFALRGAMESLAREYADSSLCFQWLAPRATDTEMNDARTRALNQELKVAVDAPEKVALAILDAIEAGRRRQQIGWPEKLFARLNGVFPELVDRALRGQLSAIRRHAQPAASVTEGVL